MSEEKMFMPLCFSCKHLQEDKTFYDEKIDESIYFCDAYPDGIPQAILDIGHIFPKPNDNGIQFELKDGKVFSELYSTTQEEEDRDYQEQLEFLEYARENGIEILY